MNYRHAFHAGNVGDCLKHALLDWLLRALSRKPAPFSVLDTHAGIGRYDLDGPAARTGEFRDGILRLLENPPPPLADYVGLVRQLGLYPGSPAIIQASLRPDDRLVCCELHPEDAATLKRHFAHDRQVAVHHRDGYQAVVALLPPPQRRGLTLIDPPFEGLDEFGRLAEAIIRARERFAGGVVAAWYPIKHRAPIRDFFASLQASRLRDVAFAELLLRAPIDPQRLNGCGLLVAAPPFGFLTAASAIVGALAERLGGTVSCGMLIDE